MDYSFILQQIVFGLTLGCLYSLIAIGYTMVYGVIRLINFAHGDLLMVAAYIAFFGIVMFHLPWPVVIVISVALTGLLGILIDRGSVQASQEEPPDQRSHYGYRRLISPRKPRARTHWRSSQDIPPTPLC